MAFKKQLKGHWRKQYFIIIFKHLHIVFINGILQHCKHIVRLNDLDLCQGSTVHRLEGIYFIVVCLILAKLN